MPEVYESERPIKVIGGTVAGGITVILRNPSEVSIVRNACAFAARSAAPLHALYGLLNAREDEFLPLFGDQWIYEKGFHRDWTQAVEGEVEHDAYALDAIASFAENSGDKTIPMTS